MNVVDVRNCSFMLKMNKKVDRSALNEILTGYWTSVNKNRAHVLLTCKELWALCPAYNSTTDSQISFESPLKHCNKKQKIKFNQSRDHAFFKVWAQRI